MIEKMKQWLKALESMKETLAEHDEPTTFNEDEAITSLRQAIAELESQEPVAWIHNFIEGGISIGKRPSDLDRHPDRWTALYKDPKPCPTCEALCRTVMLDQTSHDTTPPQRTEPIQSLQCAHCQVTIETLNDKVMHLLAQRTWVGLTDEERLKLYREFEDCLESDGWEYEKAIEAKLKEKNCL
jgi:hypothetical protein